MPDQIHITEDVVNVCVNETRIEVITVGIQGPAGRDGGGGEGGAVSSVAGRTGDVVLSRGDVQLSRVDNTSDVEKPVSSAQQAALDLKAPVRSTPLVFNFGGASGGEVAVTGTTTSFSQRVPFDLVASTTNWRLVISTYGDPVTINSVYLAKADPANLGPNNYKFLVTPVSLESSSGPVNTFVTEFQDTIIEKGATYLLSIGSTATNGSMLSIAEGMGGYFTSNAADAGLVSVSGGVARSKGYFDVRLEFVSTDEVDTALFAGNSLLTNCTNDASKPLGARSAWPHIYGRLTNTVVSNLAIYGATGDQIANPFQLDRAAGLAPRTVFYEGVSNSIAQGKTTTELSAEVVSFITNVKAKWPAARIGLGTVPKRDFSTSDGNLDKTDFERTRLNWNALLRQLPGSLGQDFIIDIDQMLSDPASGIMFVKYASGDGNHQNYIGHVALATLAGSPDPGRVDIEYVKQVDQYILQITEKLENKSSSPALGESDTLYPTQKAVKSYVDSSVTAVTSELDAKVSGPSSALDNAVLRFDDNSGALVQSSTVTIDDDGSIYSNGWRLLLSASNLKMQSPFGADLVDLSTYSETASFINFRATSKYGGAIPAIVRGSSGQTVSLQEWHDNSGDRKSWIDEAGNFCTKSPDGTEYRITVANGGALMTTAI